MQPIDPKRNATPDNTTPEPSPGPLKNEPTPERAAEEKRKRENDAVEPQGREQS